VANKNNPARWNVGNSNSLELGFEVLIREFLNDTSSFKTYSAALPSATLKASLVAPDGSFQPLVVQSLGNGEYKLSLTPQSITLPLANGENNWTIQVTLEADYDKRKVNTTLSLPLNLINLPITATTTVPPTSTATPFPTPTPPPCLDITCFCRINPANPVCTAPLKEDSTWFWWLLLAASSVPLAIWLFAPPLVGKLDRKDN
jgi:hypothetical protein